MDCVKLDSNWDYPWLNIVDKDGRTVDDVLRGNAALGGVYEEWRQEVLQQQYKVPEIDESDIW